MKTEISIDPLGGKRLNQLLALFVASALIPSTLLAQPVDQFKGDKGHDPTGAWLIKGAQGQYILTVFHNGGTLTGDVQGESAFDPAAPGSNIINSPESGVWQKIGSKTFAATFLTIEYEAPSGNFHQFDRVQFTGELKSSNQMTLTALITFFDANGHQLGDAIPSTANGVRIPLQVLPSTSDTIPVPPAP